VSPGWSVCNKKISKSLMVTQIPQIGRGGAFRRLLNYASFPLSLLIFIIRNKRKVEKFEKVLCMGFSPLTSVMPLYLYHKKLDLYLWYQDLWPDSLSSGGVELPLWLLSGLRKVGMIFMGGCKMVMIQSEGFAGQLSTLKTRMEYLPNSAKKVRIERIRRSRTEASVKMCYAGNLGEAQDVLTMLKFLVNCKCEGVPFTVDVYGNGLQKLELIQWLERQEDKDIRYCGIRERSVMESMLQDYDVMLMPLTSKPPINKTIPSKMQTYMAGGKPVVHFGVGHVGEMINMNRLGISIDPVMQSSRETLVSFLRRYSSCREMYENNVERYFEREFEVSKTADKMTRLIWG